MTPPIDRKAAIAAYKERRDTPGIVALRIAGGLWIGATPTLDKAENRHRFMLRLGQHASPTLQAAWRDHGDDALSFEVLERQADADERDPRRIRTWLKKRQADWCARLGGVAV
ncbi:MAG: GIY-YIG nuclease family protein [Azospirillaceae bacterium]